MKLPTFLIIGAAKSGTTSLYHYLSCHPHVYMSPVKETNFFALEGRGAHHYWQGYARSKRSTRLQIDTWERFCQMFGDATHARAVGEASPAHLYVDQCAARIKHYLPQVKLVVILRNPVERAFSHYKHYVRDGREKRSDLIDALRDEQARQDAGLATTWSYLQMGFYHQQLQRYLDHFDRAQMRIYLYEDLVTDTDALLEDLCSFVGVEYMALPGGLSRHNMSGIPRSTTLQSWLYRDSGPKRLLKTLLPTSILASAAAQVQTLNLRPGGSLDPEPRQWLSSLYAEDMLRLQDLLDRDLSAWMTDACAAMS